MHAQFATVMLQENDGGYKPLLRREACTDWSHQVHVRDFLQLLNDHPVAQSRSAWSKS